MTLPILPPETGDVKAGFFCYYVENKDFRKEGENGKTWQYNREGQLLEIPLYGYKQKCNILPEYHNVDVDDKEIL